MTCCRSAGSVGRSGTISCQKSVIDLEPAAVALVGGQPFVEFLVRQAGAFRSADRAVFVRNQADDVIAKLRLDRLADLTRLGQGKGCVFELFDHLAASEPAQVAAFIFVAGIGRVSCCQFRPIFARLQLGQDVFGNLFIGYQDMLRPNLLFARTALRRSQLLSAYHGRAPIRLHSV